MTKKCTFEGLWETDCGWIRENTAGRDWSDEQSEQCRLGITVGPCVALRFYFYMLNRIYIIY